VSSKWRVFVIVAAVFFVGLGGAVLGEALGDAGAGQKEISLVDSRHRHRVYRRHSIRLHNRGRVISKMPLAGLRRVMLHQRRPFKALRDGPVGTKNQALRESSASLAASVLPETSLRASTANVASASAEPTASEPGSGLRTVYEGSGVAAGLLPTSEGLCFIEIVSEIGSSICTTNPNVSSGLGLLLHVAGEYHLVGVLPEGAASARLEEANGEVIDAPLDAEDGYAITTKSVPTALRITNSNGSAASVRLNGPPPPPTPSPSTTSEG
jgi:hypothetical protein